MTRYYTQGSDAAIYAKQLESAIAKLEDAADETCDAVEYFEGELEERDETIKALEEDIRELDKKLAAMRGDDALKILRKISMYINNEISELEKLRNVEKESTDNSSGTDSDVGSQGDGNESLEKSST